MPDGSMIKPPAHSERTDEMVDQMEYHAKRVHALLVSMHELLPDHAITSLAPREAEIIRIKLLDMAMEESRSLLETAKVI